MIGFKRRLVSALLLVGAVIVPSPTGTAEDAQTLEGDGRQLIEQHLERGIGLLKEGEYTRAQGEFVAVLQYDATHGDALRLMTKAQKALDAKRTKSERASRRMLKRAEKLATEFAKEKARAQLRQEAGAKAQVARAREQQLKYLYNRGQNLYSKGAYQAAIDTLQQMVLLDPTHPLIRAAQRLISRAETKLAGARARASAKAWPGQGSAAVSELEQQLAAKRIELETVLRPV